MATGSGQDQSVRSAVLAALLLGTLTVVVLWGAHQSWLAGNEPGRAAVAAPGSVLRPASSIGVEAPTATMTPSEVVTPSASPSALMTQTPSAPATPSATQSPAAPEADGPAGVVNAIKARATVKYAVSSRGEVTVPLDQFRAEVATILDDPLGWRGIGIVFMEVGETAEADITVWLTEPAKVPSFASICSSNLSCSIGSNIIINEERWLTGALPGAMDDVPIEAYRMMVVNHEVGHWLGHHEHSACPGEGEIAPLMMQQSKGLDGCIFNPYPLPDEANAPDLGLD